MFEPYRPILLAVTIVNASFRRISVNPDTFQATSVSPCVVTYAYELFLLLFLFDVVDVIFSKCKTRKPLGCIVIMRLVCVVKCINT